MNPDLGLRPATELLGLLQARELSARELLEHYLTRIERLNGELNAVVTLDLDRARAAAAASDDRRARGDEVGALEGLPMTLKDAIAVAGVRCTGGAEELADHVPTVDADAVTRLRDAGAVVFGKTNLPRWSADAQATNTIFGTTNNPWNLTRTPGGSSGGASAAMAAGLSGLEVGTDIGGSVRLPAHFAGVCGHKPSYGVIPQRGYVDHVSYGWTDADINVLGPIARSTADLAMLFDVLAGPRADDAVGWRLDLPAPRGGPTELRVAACLDNEACPVGEDVRGVLEALVTTLEADGVTIDRKAWPDVAFEDVREVGVPLISAATAPALSEGAFEHLRAVASDPTEANRERAARARRVAMFHRDWALLTERRERNRAAWASFFADVDVLLAPVAIVPAFDHQIEGDFTSRTLTVDGVERPYLDIIVWTAQFGYVYLPATVVPAGWTPEGLPVGVQVVGPYLGDRTTLAFARHVERLTGGYRVPPMAGLG